jgi:16S rRNA (cytosine1402-N4)-methyltransferase
MHVSVLLDEAVGALAPKRGGRFVDGTAGGGGHAARLLEAGPIELVALDRDIEAVERVKARLSPFGARATVVHASFDRWRSVIDGLGWNSVDGILLDLGFSSFQMDTAERGFSFLREGPLDMRMNRAAGPSAADLVNTLDEGELVRLLREFGEDPDAPRIARALVARRPITTTAALAAAVSAAVSPRRRYEKGIHPATLTFQALRIAVNDELGMLDRFLGDLPAGLAGGGRVAVISFHSLEDRRVKHRFRDLSRGCVCPPDMPVCGCGKTPQMKELTRGAVKPSAAEAAAHPRARSARLRAAAKVPA